MSTAYNMVMTPAFFGAVRRGALDHWQGETVPVRGPNREIIGEATVVSVDHREDGNVYVVVETELDLDHDKIARIAGLLRGRSPMSFKIPENISVPHQPKRDDDVARWLKTLRDVYDPRGGVIERSSYQMIDAILDEYRARADYGLTLDDDLSQLPDGW